MLRIHALDPKFPIMQQLHVSASPIVLVNTFSVSPEDCDALLEAWTKDATWMKAQPGFISTQLHRAVGESYMFLNYAVWQSVTDFRAAFSHPDFQNALSAYPDSASAAPHLFEKIAVPNICVA
jgi:heme-degrading monooxygenase HmoA